MLPFEISGLGGVTNSRSIATDAKVRCAWGYYDHRGRGDARTAKNAGPTMPEIAKDPTAATICVGRSRHDEGHGRNKAVRIGDSASRERTFGVRDFARVPSA